MKMYCMHTAVKLFLWSVIKVPWIALVFRPSTSQHHKRGCRIVSLAVFVTLFSYFVLKPELTLLIGFLILF